MPRFRRDRSNAPVMIGVALIAALAGGCSKERASAVIERGAALVALAGSEGPTRSASERSEVRGPLNNPDPHQMRLEALLAEASLSEQPRVIREKAPVVRMLGTRHTGRLPPEIVQRVVRSQFGQMRLCFEKGLRMNPPPFPRVSVSFTIELDGSVSHAKGASDQIDTEIVSCVAATFGAMSFPPPLGGTVRVTYPVLFQPGAS